MQPVYEQPEDWKEIGERWSEREAKVNQHPCYSSRTTWLIEKWRRREKRVRREEKEQNLREITPSPS